MEAYRMSFSKVIGSDQGASEHFHVPKYQREYAWGRKEWDHYSFEDSVEKEETLAIPGSIKAKLIKRKIDPRKDEPGGFSVGKHSSLCYRHHEK